MPKTKKTTKRVVQGANTITEGIINTILNAGYSASRINTQGQYDENMHGGGDWWQSDKRGGYRPSGSRNGYYDISACIEGRFVVIEVKYNGDQLSADQKEFKKEVWKASGIAVEIETWGEFLGWWHGPMQNCIDEWRHREDLKTKMDSEIDLCTKLVSACMDYGLNFDKIEDIFSRLSKEFAPFIVQRSIKTVKGIKQNNECVK